MSEPGVERRLAAVLAADMVGYSRLIEADERGTLARQKTHRKELIDPAITEHGGRIVKLTGDGYLAEFSTAVEAVRCAVLVQRAMVDREAAQPEELRIIYRVGINIGDIVVDEDDIFGEGVNIAARVEEIAEPGGIAITGAAFDAVKNIVEVGFEYLGMQEVKNISQPLRTYRILLDPKMAGEIVGESRGWLRAPTWAAAVFLIVVAASILLFFAGAGSWWLVSSIGVSDRGKFRLPDRPSVAVLPLNTFSNVEEQRFLADGIAEDIITQLARNSELTVMARTASFAFKDKGLSAMEIASKLDVHYILEGSVRRVGEQIRITAQLIDSKSGNHVWAKRYDSAAASIFETQDDIVENIVGTLFSEIRETEKAAILRRPPNTLDVYELTLRGLARKHRLNPEDSRLARKDLLRAVELDPDYAPAWLYLGWVEGIAIAFKWIDGLDQSNLKDAIGKIERAIELDPTLATAYQALGILKSWDGDAEGALLAARRSVELGPGDADNLLFQGRALASIGEFDQAVAHARHAVALNPSRPSYYDAALGRALWGQGNYDEASIYSNDCLTKTPGYTGCRIFQIASYYGMGDAPAASEAVTALLQQSPSLTVSDALNGMGFPGDAKANERLAKHLTEAGLPINEGASAKK